MAKSIKKRNNMSNGNTRKSRGYGQWQRGGYIYERQKTIARTNSTSSSTDDIDDQRYRQRHRQRHRQQNKSKNKSKNKSRK